ncbi:MAG: DUF1501 domain-containing protein [Chthonomonadales bacterium]|nr:DUF1501 domain-containing protein [Chthonomonadales bacterium]
MGNDQPATLTRRDALKAGIASAAAAAVWPSGLAYAVEPRAAAGLPGKARSVIQIWVWGGPCHIDTFDPKPGAGAEYTGPLTAPIETSVSGIRIGELLPELGKIADKYSLIRSLTHENNGHETASYITQTGRMPGGRIVYPGIGAVVSLFKGYEAGYKGLIPPYMVLTQLQGRFSESGFLGTRAKPFATGGDPNQPRFVVEGVVAQGITDPQQAERRELRRKLDTLAVTLKDDPRIVALGECEAAAYDLILGEGRKIFDLSQEKDDLRARYGRSTFGQSCLMARRLVEQGVPFVTINYQGWDTHKSHFETMRRKLPEMDRGVATLIQDLSDRGLLDSTIVWWCGEFGRTPRVQWEAPWNGGRGHWGSVFSALVAGGGFRGGQVVGASDATGSEVANRPVHPADVLRSMYMLMGIDPDGPLPHPQGLDVRVAPATSEGIKTYGHLAEIM